MKKLFSLVALLSVPVAVMAQTELNKRQFDVIEPSAFDCLYRYSVEGVNEENGEFKDEFLTILQVGKTSAKFWDYGAFVADSVSYLSDASAEEVKNAQNKLAKQKFFFDAEIFQNFPKNKITENGIIGLNYFTYSEPKSAVKWDLASDTLSVMETLCYKATTEFGGRKWTAWYAPSIPSANGPWKLSGLPGLILRATEESGTHTFEAYSIRQRELPIYNNISKQRVKAPKAQYLKAKVQHEFNPMDIPAEQIQEISITNNGDDKQIFINGILFRMHPNGYHPLEK